MIEFSIIVPIYNVEPYLHQCINSILAQTYSNFELILVDDGSPDSCGKICDKFAKKDARIKVIHKPNGGVTSARKTGVDHAKGEYICWVDGDDHIGSNLLQTLHAIIAGHAPDMIAYGFKKVKDDGTVLEIATNKLTSNQCHSTEDAGFYDQLVFIPNAGHLNYGALQPNLWSKAVRREIMVPAMLAVPDEVAMGEDVAATNQALCNCKTVYVSDVTEYYYRYNESSMTNTFKRDMLHRRQVLFEFMNAHMEKIPQENKDAYACMQIIAHIAGAARSIDYYCEFLQHIKEEMTPELHEIVDRCKIPKLPSKQRVAYWLLKRYWYWAFWLKNHLLVHK